MVGTSNKSVPEMAIDSVGDPIAIPGYPRFFLVKAILMGWIDVKNPKDFRAHEFAMEISMEMVEDINSYASLVQSTQGISR